MAGAAELGAAGEAAAVGYLRGRGLTLVQVNLRVGRDEIDAVFLDGDDLVVVEVKTRSSPVMGTGLEAVTPAKLARMRRAIAEWLRRHGATYAGIRFDVVEVAPVAGTYAVEWFRDVA